MVMESSQGQGWFSKNITLGNMITAGTVLVTVILAWSNLSNSVENLETSLNTVTQRVNLSELAANAERERDRLEGQIDSVRLETKLVLDAINARLNLLGERSNETSKELATLTAEVRFVKERMDRQEAKRAISNPTTITR